jgi:Ca-activated chloride channel family protein
MELRFISRTASRETRAATRFVQITTAIFATLALTIGFSARAPAQPRATCPDGLMRAGEAGTGVLLLRTREPGCYLPAPRVAANVEVAISGPVARTRVTQRFENPSNGWVEGIYVFPLPEAAAVDMLKMQIGERFIEGVIKERQEARRIYEEAKAEGRKASLVEQERPNVFTNQVANIAPHDAIVVQIEYQESLRFDVDKYHLRVPMVVAPRYSPRPQPPAMAQLVAMGEPVRAPADPVPDRERLESPLVPPQLGTVNPVTLTVALETGFPLGVVESESHDISVARNGTSGASVAIRGEVPADRDFTLSFAAVPGTTPILSLLKERVGEEDYLLALVMPPATRGSDTSRPRETIFVIDNSGSMGGESMEQARAGLLLGLDRLRPQDMFNVIRFDDTMTILFRGVVPATAENVAHAKNYVAGLEAQGGTEMLPALIAALNDATPSDRMRLRQVIFLTDGAVGNEAQLFGAIGEKLGRSRLFTVGIGSAPNAYFMSGAARAGRGTFTYIGSSDQVVMKMAELFAKLEHPVLTELTAVWPESVSGESWPNPLPDLYSGEPVVITMKAPNLAGRFGLSGQLAGAPWRVELDLEAAGPARGIEKLWARNKIAALDESRVHGVEAEGIAKAVLEVALRHHLVSRLTSLVAVDVTPSRPADMALNSGRVPVNLPAGWDPAKWFGETQRVPERRAEMVPPAMLAQLAFAADPASAVQPGDAGLQLPQGGTLSTLFLILGLALLFFGYALTRADRDVKRALG